MSIACPWCEREFQSEKALLSHSSRAHNKKRLEYVLHTQHDNVHPLCACGCGEKVVLSQHHGNFNRFVRGHQYNDPEVLEKMLEGSLKHAADEDAQLENSKRMTAWWDGLDDDVKTSKISNWLGAMQQGHKKIAKTSEYSKKVSKRMKGLWASSKGDLIREQMKTSEARVKVSERTRAGQDNPEFRAKMSANATRNQILGIIGPNKTYRSKRLNPFTNTEEHYHSSWEVLFVDEAIKNNVPVRRWVHDVDPIVSYVAEDGTTRKYVPDFITLSGKTVVEIKGYTTQRDNCKHDMAKTFFEDKDISFVVLYSKQEISSSDTWAIIK